MLAVPRDIREFIDGYPGIGDDPEAFMNLEFYSNTLRCRPDNLLIDEIHERYVRVSDGQGTGET